MGSPATFPFYKNVGAAADTNFSPTIPLALYSLFQLKVRAHAHTHYTAAAASPPWVVRHSLTYQPTPT